MSVRSSGVSVVQAHGIASVRYCPNVPFARLCALSLVEQLLYVVVMPKLQVPVTGYFMRTLARRSQRQTFPQGTTKV